MSRCGNDHLYKFSDDRSKCFHYLKTEIRNISCVMQFTLKTIAKVHMAGVCSEILLYMACSKGKEKYILMGQRNSGHLQKKGS